jgi:hypothetical protein
VFGILTTPSWSASKRAPRAMARAQRRIGESRRRGHKFPLLTCRTCVHCVELLPRRGLQYHRANGQRMDGARFKRDGPREGGALRAGKDAIAPRLFPALCLGLVSPPLTTWNFFLGFIDPHTPMSSICASVYSNGGRAGGGLEDVSRHVGSPIEELVSWTKVKFQLDTATCYIIPTNSTTWQESFQRICDCTCRIY